MENKKSLTTLLIIFGIVLIASSLYLFYFSKIDVKFTWLNFFNNQVKPSAETQQIEAAKSLSEENIKNFLKNNKLDDLVKDPQYQNLVDPGISIEIGEVSNPAPFTKPTASEPSEPLSQ